MCNPADNPMESIDGTQALSYETSPLLAIVVTDVRNNNNYTLVTSNYVFPTNKNVICF